LSPPSEPRGVFLAWSCRGATARPRPWTPRRASRSAASGSAYAASPTARGPARPRGGEAGAGPAPASGAAARERRRSEARRAAEAGGGRGLRLLPLPLLLLRRPWRARGVGRWESGWGAAFVARVRAHASVARGGVAAAIEIVRVVWEPTSRRAPRGESGWPRSRYHLFACAFEIYDLNIVPLILQVCKCSSTEK
jgi:hypothetical protein